MKYYIIPNLKDLNKALKYSKEYDLGFEYNDFFNPDILDNEVLLKKSFDTYKNLNRINDTFHGVDQCGIITAAPLKASLFPLYKKHHTSVNMRKYYYIDSNMNRQGPIEAYRLPSLGVRANNYVWTKGMKQWEHAYNVPDLSTVFPSKKVVYEQHLTNDKISEMRPKPSDAQSMATATVNIKPSRTLLDIIKPLLFAIGCFVLAGLVVWLIVLGFKMLSDGENHYVRVKVAIFILPLMLVWEGLKFIVQFIKQFFN